MVFVELLIACIAITVVLCYWNVKKTYSFWLKYNIPFEKAQFPYGSIKDVGKTIHIYELTTNIYKQMKSQSPLVGFYTYFNPAVVITNLDAVKQILITDSNLFTNRGFYVNSVDDPLSGNLFNLDGPRHEALRTKLTHTFTSEKMKMMFLCMERMTNRLLSYLNDCVEDTTLDLNMKDIVARYITDCMGTIFLGVDCNSLKDENAELRTIGRRYLVEGRERGLKHFFRNTFQDMARQLKITETPQPVSDFFMRTVKETICNREMTKTKQNDLIDLLIQLKNVGEQNGTFEEKSGLITFDEAISNAFLFYVAGFETTSNTLSFCLYELAKNQDIQNKVRKHVVQVLQQNNDKQHYDMFSELKYLDQVINETLRKYPPAPIVFRNTTADYKLPNTNMVIPMGTQVMVPIWAIHHDEDLWPKPELYDPNRFTDDNTLKRHSCSFMPFGDGSSRACIGKQFAMMQMRMTLVNLLRKYRFSICSKTPFPLKFDKKASVLTADDIWVNVEKI